MKQATQQDLLLRMVSVRPFRSHFFLVLLLASFFIVSAAIFFNFIRNGHQRDTLHTYQVSQDVAWEAVSRIHQNTMQSYFRQHILSEDTLSILRMAQDSHTRDRARDLLYQHIAPTYKELQRLGLGQLQFHLPSSVSLLRMHMPERYGDDLSSIRPSVRRANETRSPVYAFETGRVISGFRMVFPIITAADEHLGTVEFSLPFETLRLEMQHLYPKREFQLILNREFIDPILFEELHHYYVTWTGNPAYLEEDPLRMLPYAPPQMSNTSRLKLQTLRTHQPFQQALASRIGGTFPLTHDGDSFVVILTPIRNTHDVVVGYLISIESAPELKQIQVTFWIQYTVAMILILIAAALLYSLLLSRQRSQQEKKYLEVIANTMAEGLYVSSTAGIITAINRAGAEILGYTPSEVIGQDGHALFHTHSCNNYLPPEQCPVMTAIKRQEPFFGEEIFRRKDGQLIPVRLSVKPFADKRSGSVITFSDISALKDTEAALRRSMEEAEAANRAKSDFLANMSHEIRTPMNAIIGLGELAIQDKDGCGSCKDSDAIFQIHSSSQMLLGILNNILDYSKIEAGKLELDNHVFSLITPCQQAISLFERAISDKGIRLELIFPPEAHTMVVGDSIRFGQIITNLISNALKFTEHGKIRFEITVVERTAQSIAFHFSLSDTGIGMDQQQVARVFQPFTQADTSITRRFGGTGLGLAIAHHMTDAMGGTLGVTSQPNFGTTFFFTLRFEYAKELAQAPLHLPVAAQSLSGCEILVAEDNEINQQVVCRMLQREGIVVTVAHNGAEAVQYAQNKAFALILMDLQMPIMDGYEATRRIREFAPFIPIIALTAAALVEEREKVLASGMNDHLSKPIRSEHLIRTISYWLDIEHTAGKGR
ncbi:response regulator [Chrysiogenes arsenatis]|uniref:response regulator n=1 Tax=Chrysiogenes arsenatis TaxID=309797 RepID=UPI0004092385|nr:response regulator [Chrysiogenes arsenatis]